VSFDRAGVAAHATQLASAIQGNLKRSLEALGVVSTGCSTFVRHMFRVGEQRQQQGVSSSWRERCVRVGCARVGMHGSRKLAWVLQYAQHVLLPWPAAATAAAAAASGRPGG
jgi:hypothetical protein